MAFWEAVRLALQTIRAQKLKSAFSIIGVFIGVMFLIAVVSVVQGMNRYMTDKFAGTLLGVNTFRLRQFPDVPLGNVTDSTWRVRRRPPRVNYDGARAVVRRVTAPVPAASPGSPRPPVVAGRRRGQGLGGTAPRQRRPREPDNFALETADEVLDFWGKISRVLFVALPGLVAVSLVVGGIVIMNIMLMAVAERTREIGIRKSLGARRRDILRQFLVEATTLATAGATGGVVLGIGLAGAVAALTPLPAAVAPWPILVGVALGGGVGVVAGVYPASRAARLDPIAALRHET